MSSASISNLSIRTPDLIAPYRPPAQKSENGLPPERSAQAPESAKAAEPAPPEAMPSEALPPAALPSTVEMRFEINALNQAWMVAMTDTSSGDVVRKIPLKGVARDPMLGLHQSGAWVDKAV